MTTKISSLSVMIGTPACNLKCPFCISRQTHRVVENPQTAVPVERISYLADKFLQTCDGIPYAILTGKGEPTLAPQGYISDVIGVLTNLRGPGQGLVVELQTNGTLLNANNMWEWKYAGLNTIALSCVSHDDGINSRLLSDDKVKWDLGGIAARARDFGFLVRLTATMTRGGIDSPDSMLEFLKFAREAGAHQVTLREMGKPRDYTRPGSKAVAEWIDNNFVDPQIAINTMIAEKAIEKDPLPWAKRFSYLGLSVVITDTMNPPKDGLVRSAIIQPDGHLYASWDDPADIII
jgi:molybdenum cofactor biosynthesis enzyme MoaA